MTGSSRFGHFNSFDAGAASFILGSFPSGSFLTLYDMTWGSNAWAAWIGSAEGLEHNGAVQPYFTCVGNGYIGRHDGYLVYNPDLAAPSTTALVGCKPWTTFTCIRRFLRMSCTACKTAAVSGVVHFNKTSQKFREPRAFPRRTSLFPNSKSRAAVASGSSARMGKYGATARRSPRLSARSSAGTRRRPAQDNRQGTF